MTTHRTILKDKLKESNIGHREIAERMGWASNATVSLKLAGKRDWSNRELERMCNIAGVTILWLADNSSDLVLARHKASISIALGADSLTDEQRQVVLSLINQMKS